MEFYLLGMFNEHKVEDIVNSLGFLDPTFSLVFLEQEETEASKLFLSVVSSDDFEEIVKQVYQAFSGADPVLLNSSETSLEKPDRHKSKPASPSSSQSSTPPIQQTSQKAQASTTELVKQSLPTYAHVLLQTDSEILKSTVKSSPEYLERIMASTALFSNSNLEHIDQTIKEEELALAQINRQLNLPFQLDQEQKNQNPENWYNQSFMDLDNSEAFRDWPYVLWALNQYPDDVLLKDFSQKMIFEMRKVLEIKQQIRGYEGDDDYILYDSLDHAEDSLAKLSDIIFNYLGKKKIGLPDGELNSNKLVNESQTTKQLVDDFIEYRIDINQISKVKFADLREKANIETRLRMAKSQKQRVEKLCEQPQFEEQKVGKIAQYVLGKRRPHVVFAKSVFKDGLFYINPVRYNAKVTRQNIGGDFSMSKIKHGKNKPASFTEFERVWLNSAEKADPAIQQAFGMSETGIWLSEKPYSKFSSVSIEDPNPEKIKKQADQKLEMVLKMAKKEPSQVDPELLQAYKNMWVDFMSSLKPMETVESHPTAFSNLEINGLVDEKDDHRVRDMFKAWGATLEENVLDLPKYESWYKVQPGHSLVIEQDGIKIGYTPREFGKKIRVKRKAPLSLVKSQDKIIKRVRDAFEPLQFDTDSFVCLTSEGTKQCKPLVESQFLSNGDFEKAKKALQTGEKTDLQIKTDNGDFKTQSFKVEKAYNPLNKDLSIPEKIDEFRRFQLLIDEDWSEVGHNRFMQTHLAFEYRSLIKIENMSQQDLAFEFSSISDFVAGVEDHNLFKLHRKGYIKDEDFASGEVELDVEQAAPRSETGRLWVQGEDMEKAVELLQQKGLIDKLHDEVPLNKIPGGKNKVTVELPEYLTSEISPKLPVGCMPLHGITGAQLDFDSFERLENVIKAGGLFSIKNRRHMGIQTSSLSPLGDMGSGIDHGVPTTLGENPNWGEHIFFVFKPSILRTREVWFAPRDYGGGIDRSGSYDEYAWSIGQPGYTTPPSHKSRKEHLDAIENREVGKDNEAYIADGISLEEFDSIVVNTQKTRPEVIEKITSLVEGAKVAGYLPNSVDLQFVDGIENSDHLISNIWKKWFS